MASTALLIIDRFRVRTTSLDFLLLEWRVKPTNRPISDFKFSIFRSQSPEGPFTQIIEGLEETFFFKDVTAPQKSRWRQWYYKIRATEKFSDNFTESSIATNAEAPDRIGLAIIKKNDLLLRNKNGIDAFILIERTFGQRCGECWDTTKSRKKKSGCPVCNDTGIIQGYFDPIKVRINVSPSPKVSQFANFGELTPNQTAAWMSNFPEVKQRDIVVEGVAGGTRWRVTKMSPTRKNRALIHQNLVLTEINRSDIEWSIPVPELEPAF
jgi:hypothetical protein